MVGAGKPGTQIFGERDLARRHIGAAIMLGKQVGQPALSVLPAAADGCVVDLPFAIGVTTADVQFHFPRLLATGADVTSHRFNSSLNGA